VPLRFSDDPPTGVAGQLSGWLPSTRGGAQHQLSVGFKWVTVSLDNLAQGRFLEGATPGRWRFLVLQDGAPFAHATLDDANQVVGLSQGHAVQGFVDALTRAEGLDGDYLVRVVEVPALRLMALWLHGDQDWLIAFPFDMSPLGSLTPTAPADALPALQAQAASALAAMGRGGPIGN
jgi:hypothetical protein